MLTVLGGLAEFERELIRARTGEGRARAKARGVKLGRKPKLTPHQQREAIAAAKLGEPLTRHRPQLQRQPQHDFAPGEKNFFARDLAFPPTISIARMAERVRDYLGVPSCRSNRNGRRRHRT